MLFASPTQATVLPAIAAVLVVREDVGEHLARWYSFVRPLITGTRELSAKLDDVLLERADHDVDHPRIGMLVPPSVSALCSRIQAPLPDIAGPSLATTWLKPPRPNSSFRASRKTGKFRPSDWSERLAGVMASGRGERAERASPVFALRASDDARRPEMRDPRFPAARDVEPMAFDFVLNFAKRQQSRRNRGVRTAGLRRKGDAGGRGVCRARPRGNVTAAQDVLTDDKKPA